jgi:hypothetical protein
MARNDHRPETNLKDFSVGVAYDDTHTVVRIFTTEPDEGTVPIAEGRAKRRKGDPRDHMVGLALATGRAFQALADQELEFARARLEDG